MLITSLLLLFALLFIGSGFALAHKNPLALNHKLRRNHPALNPPHRKNLHDTTLCIALQFPAYNELLGIDIATHHAAFAYHHDTFRMDIALKLPINMQMARNVNLAFDLRALRDYGCGTSFDWSISVLIIVSKDCHATILSFSKIKSKFFIFHLAKL